METVDVINSRLTEKSESKTDVVDSEHSGKKSFEVLITDPALQDEKDTTKLRSRTKCRSRSRSGDSAEELDKSKNCISKSRSRSRSPLSNLEQKGAEADLDLENRLGKQQDLTKNCHSPSSTHVNLSFFSSGPVFPARHTRDLQLAQNVESDEELKQNEINFNTGNLQNQEKEIGKSTSLPSFLNQDGVESEALSNNGSNEEPLSEIKEDITKASQGDFKDPDFLTNSLGHQSIGADVPALKETMVDEKGDLESESLAPLSASFFNCQYQTPSWIDDPLIGVPASAMENKNTHRKTGADMRILTAYMRSLNEMRLPEAIPPAELDRYLSSFFLVVRKADGSEYEPCSLRAMLASIERYLRFKNYPLSLTRDSAFSNMRNILKLKQQTLRSIGKGQKTASEISPSSLAREGKIAHLFKSQEMGPYTPSSVVFTLCFYFCMYLKLRKSTENKKLLWGDIALLKDESGREFLTFSSQMLRRNQGSSKGNLRQRSYRVWADPSSPEKDPVTIYKFYAQKRPASTNTNFSPFYLGVNVLYPTQGQPWYRPAAMGINKLNEMVRQIRDITGVRTTSDFQGSDPQGKNKPVLDALSNETNNGQGPHKDVTEMQDYESHVVKTEIVEDGEDDDDSCSNLAIDFSQDAQASPLRVPSTTDGGSAFSLQHTLSEGDNSNDSFPRRSQHLPSAQMNGAIGQEVRPDEDLDLATSASSPPDSPLNCSTKDRISQPEVEDMQQDGSPECPENETVSVEQAKQQLMSIVRKMEPSSLLDFEQWLRAVKFEIEPFTGQILCKADERQTETPPFSVKATSSCSPSGANIVLNISLSHKALQGDVPITVTADALQSTSEPHLERNSPADGHNISTTAKPIQSHLTSPQSTDASSKTASATSTQHQLVSLSDAPLDLATSPVSRTFKSSTSSSLPPQQSKSNPWAASSGSSISTNGRPLLSALFPNTSTKSNNSAATASGNGSSSSSSSSSSTSTSLISSPLAKHLRLSAEQAEAYTSASILASLSSASLASERLRLHIMQAGLTAGNAQTYGLDPHTAAGLLDLAASSEVMRSQLLQHYGMKAEPK
ncbi:Zinc finger mym-type protein 2 [Plakobranchus ocellatus]|uniref:Zinc finger mym-type protein 2 n=1 Tax=Plakobranchus ocellatus TaxID=259542 RepID=A0AAV3ZGT4_9GAST|nr:Zinc finger mym-type protein 2 [Plakobranchus ocellatus]